MAVLGHRHWYRYDSDDTKSYRIQTLDYLAEAAGLESCVIPHSLSGCHVTRLCHRPSSSAAR